MERLTDDQQRLVERFVDFAQDLALKYAGLARFKGVAVEDVQQEACYGLCIAAMRFDASKDVSFKTYAYSWCKKYIMMSIKGTGEDELEDIDNLKDGDEVEADDSVLTEEKAENDCLLVRQKLQLLSAEERKVVCMVYGILYDRRQKMAVPHDFHDIGLELHVSTFRARKIYEKAMEKMKN